MYLLFRLASCYFWTGAAKLFIQKLFSAHYKTYLLSAPRISTAVEIGHLQLKWIARKMKRFFGLLSMAASLALPLLDPVELLKWQSLLDPFRVTGYSSERNRKLHWRWHRSAKLRPDHFIESRQWLGTDSQAIRYHQSGISSRSIACSNQGIIKSSSSKQRLLKTPLQSYFLVRAYHIHAVL